MEVHELKELSFSEALSRLEEKVIATRSEIEDIKSKAGESEQASSMAENLAREHAEAEEKLAKLRDEKSFELSGQNDTIMKEVIDALDNISYSIQKMLHLL